MDYTQTPAGGDLDETFSPVVSYSCTLGICSPEWHDDSLDGCGDDLPEL